MDFQEVREVELGFVQRPALAEKEGNEQSRSE
jgi:hypothetical protein